ncbi:MAG: hypothetical protein HQK65_08450 [Desulfamplus sp.]|nr:hypothetical protein [Desulfamplus sp.]
MKQNSKEPSENLTLQENLKPSPNQNQNTYSNSEMLTPSEIESLRKDLKEASIVSRAYFTAKYGHLKNQK